MSAWPGNTPGGKTPTLQFNSYNTRSVLVRKNLFPRAIAVVLRLSCIDCPNGRTVYYKFDNYNNGIIDDVFNNDCNIADEILL